MRSATSVTGAVVPTESSSTAISWGPVIGGALAATAVTLILMLVGTGLGMTMISPWSNEGASLTTFAVTSAIWAVVMQWVSSALGGYLTGRLRTKWVGLRTDEVFFRDTAHGFLAWALATLLVVGMLASHAASAVGSGVQAASTVAAGAATGAAAGTDTDTAGNATSYFVDTLFRPATPEALAAPTAENQAQAAAQASRILIASAAAGEVSPEDRTYLAQLVAARAGISQADAEARVNTVLQRIDAARLRTQEAADEARKASALVALLAALSLAIGAFIAGAAAALGGSQRDQEEDAYLVAG